MPGSAIRLLIRLQDVALWAFEPVDYASRAINGKTHLPPLRIRRRAGPLNGLENSGAEFAAYLKLMCSLKPDSRILDIGCGFGLLALYLGDYLRAPGGYVGVDVDQRAVRWATRRIASRYPVCEFRQLDIQNAAYNPEGSLAADSVRFPFDSASFDVVVVKSVFTHLRPDATRNYLSEVARLLDSQGVCLATFFVCSAEQNLDEQTRPSLDFKFGNGEWRYAIRDMPELAVALDEQSLRGMVRGAGLSVTAMHKGTWSGTAGLSYQDVVVLSRIPG